MWLIPRDAFLPTSMNLAYDLNGNTLSDGNRGFQYDDENQLVMVYVTNTVAGVTTITKSEFVFRFYVPEQQRWLNQDPIGEAGGINLMGLLATTR